MYCTIGYLCIFGVWDLVGKTILRRVMTFVHGYAMLHLLTIFFYLYITFERPHSFLMSKSSSVTSDKMVKIKRCELEQCELESIYQSDNNKMKKCD